MTMLCPHSLLELTSSIENKANRKREIHWGPRTLDIDILLYEDKVIYDEKLIIPHIDMQNRKFVLEPMMDIAPYAFNKVLNKNILQMFKELK